MSFVMAMALSLPSCISDSVDAKPERARGLTVDGKLELGRRVHRQVARSGALENAINIERCEPELLRGIVIIVHEAAFGHEDFVGAAVDRRLPITRHGLDE